jgi:hypothetical protein
MAGFALAVIVSTPLAPSSYDSVRDTISALAAVDNPHGEIMVAGFVALAVGLGVTSARIWRVLPVLSGRVAAVLIGIASAATAVAGFSRIACNPGLQACADRLEVHAPTATLIHGNAALFVFAPLILAGFAMARACRRLGERGLSRLCLLGGGVNVVIVVLVEDAATSIGGLLQRVFLVTLVGLPVLVQWRRS